MSLTSTCIFVVMISVGREFCFGSSSYIVQDKDRLVAGFSESSENTLLSLR